MTRVDSIKAYDCFNANFALILCNVIIAMSFQLTEALRNHIPRKSRKAEGNAKNKTYNGCTVNLYCPQ